MKIIILLLVVFIVASYGFLQWGGGSNRRTDTASASAMVASSRAFESVLGIQVSDFQGRIASTASSVVGALSHSVQTSIEEMVRGQVIDQVLRLYDQLGNEEKSRVKEYVCK